MEANLRRLFDAFRRSGDEAFGQLALRIVVTHVERAIFPDDGVHRPHARNMIAPARGPTGDRYHQLAGIAQTFQRCVRVRGESAVRRKRVVDVGQESRECLGA